MYKYTSYNNSLKAIKDNTALKLNFMIYLLHVCLKAIKDNTALKPQIRLKTILIFN